jgi:hypothetical protein
MVRKKSSFIPLEKNDKQWSNIIRMTSVKRNYNIVQNIEAKISHHVLHMMSFLLNNFEPDLHV